MTTRPDVGGLGPRNSPRVHDALETAFTINGISTRTQVPIRIDRARQFGDGESGEEVAFGGPRQRNEVRRAQICHLDNPVDDVLQGGCTHAGAEVQFVVRPSEKSKFGHGSLVLTRHL